LVQAPKKSARKEGQTVPTRKLSVSTSEAPDGAASSAAPTATASAPAKPEAVVLAPVAVATTPSLTIVAAASPLKKVSAESETKALLAKAEKLQKKMESKYVEISDAELDEGEPTQHTKETKKGTENTKAKEKKKMTHKRKEKKKTKAKSTDSDIEMEGPDEIQEAKGKSRNKGPSKQELQAKIQKLTELLAKQMESDGSPANSGTDVTGSRESSEDEDKDAKPTKKGKEPAKKRKKSALDDPELFTYYKSQDAASRELVLDLKERFTRRMFVNWWPEGDERVNLGEKAYKDALEAFKAVTVVSSSDELQTSEEKSKIRHKGG
jgi:hypothetical protein